MKGRGERRRAARPYVNVCLDRRTQVGHRVAPGPQLLSLERSAVGETRVSEDPQESRSLRRVERTRAETPIMQEQVSRLTLSYRQEYTTCDDVMDVGAGEQKRRHYLRMFAKV